MRPVEHRPYMPPSGGGQPYPASRDMTTPFPFGFLLAMLLLHPISLPGYRLPV